MQARVCRSDDVREGVPLAVKVGRRPVVLVRLDDELHALPGRCTHRPRPLSKGLLHGSRLLCPSHQAAFDVRTGDALEPPALDALPKYPVRVVDGEVFVAVDEGVPDRRPMPMSPYDPTADGRTFAILGAGGAGAVGAEALRRAGFPGRILLVGSEAHLPYDRPDCSEGFLTGRVGVDGLALRDAGFYEEHHIERLHARVERLDVGSREVCLDDGRRLRPDAVLVATGGVPRLLPVRGIDRKGVLTLRSVEDGAAIIEAAERSTHAAVVGAGFIGLEVAAALRKRGLEVTVVAPESLPLGPLLGERVGRLVMAVHGSAGIRFEMGHTITEVAGDGGVRAILLDDGREVPADLVVVGVGVRPATAFVDGLTLAADGGIEVDDRLRAAPGVWAAGDVAWYPDPHSGRRVRIEHWRTAQQHGIAAAFSMAGKGAPFSGVPFFWTRQQRLHLAFVGHLAGWDEVVFAGDVEAGEFIGYFFAGGRLAGAGGTRNAQIGSLSELMRCGVPPSAEELRADPDLDLVQRMTEAPEGAEPTA